MDEIDELDRLLSSEDMLEPSSGFVAATMAAVQQAATEPPPLPFPWGRLVGGMVVCGGLMGAGALLAGERGMEGLSLATLPAPVPQVAVLAPELGLAAVVILASLGTLRLLRALLTRVPADSLTG